LALQGGLSDRGSIVASRDRESWFQKMFIIFIKFALYERIQIEFSRLYIRTVYQAWFQLNDLRVVKVSFGRLPLKYLYHQTSQAHCLE